MRPQTTKDLIKYCKRKSTWFDSTAKVPTDKKLNQVISGLTQTLQGRHGKNLFFFNPIGQTLDTVDHLIIAPQGLILVEKIAVQKQIVGVDHQWWQHTRTGQLIPNENYQLKQAGLHLIELLSPLHPEGIPLFTYSVADKSFVHNVGTLADLASRVISDVQSQTPKLTPLQIQQIEQTISQACDLAYQSKVDKFNPGFMQSNYNPLKPVVLSKSKTAPHPLTGVYAVLNKWMYEEAPEARLYHQYKLSELASHQKTIQTILVSSKGVLLFSYLEPETKVDVDLNESRWKVTKIEAGSLKGFSMDNPIQLLEQQADQLKIKLDPAIPMTYRIIGLNPIDVELKHPSLVLEIHLTHALDKYWTQSDHTLTPDQLLWIKQQLGK